jgi:hypothetical protein
MGYLNSKLQYIVNCRNYSYKSRFVSLINTETLVKVWNNFYCINALLLSIKPSMEFISFGDTTILVCCNTFVTSADFSLKKLGQFYVVWCIDFKPFCSIQASFEMYCFDKIEPMPLKWMFTQLIHTKYYRFLSLYNILITHWYNINSYNLKLETAVHNVFYECST